MRLAPTFHYPIKTTVVWYWHHPNTSSKNTVRNFFLQFLPSLQIQRRPNRTNPTPNRTHQPKEKWRTERKRTDRVTKKKKKKKKRRRARKVNLNAKSPVHTNLYAFRAFVLRSSLHRRRTPYSQNSNSGTEREREKTNFFIHRSTCVRVYVGLCKTFLSSD